MTLSLEDPHSVNTGYEPVILDMCQIIYCSMLMFPRLPYCVSCQRCHFASLAAASRDPTILASTSLPVGFAWLQRS